jgi:hypothetical protein
LKLFAHQKILISRNVMSFTKISTNLKKKIKNILKIIKNHLILKIEFNRWKKINFRLFQKFLTIFIKNFKIIIQFFVKIYKIKIYLQKYLNKKIIFWLEKILL